MTAALSDKHPVRRAFANASTTYDGIAELQRLVARDLIGASGFEAISGTVLDLGCGTGFVTEILLHLFANINAVVAVDLAFPMLAEMRRKPLPLRPCSSLRYVCADAERLPLAEASVDAVVSNLALQWCDALDHTLAGVCHALRPGGMLLFSTFGPNTLRELKEAWAVVDDDAHVNDFYPAEKIRYFLHQAGFADVRIDYRTHRPLYSSVYELMRELKGIGAHSVRRRRHRQLTGKAKMARMIAAYETDRQPGGLPATFDVIQIAARKV